MPSEDSDTKKQTDRDILVETRAEVRHVKENVSRMEADFSVRFERAELANDNRFLRMDMRIDKVQESMERKLELVEADVQTLRDAKNIAAGSITFGRWILGALTVLPFLGAVLGYFINERGGP